MNTLKFYLPKVTNKDDIYDLDEYVRRTELITRMAWSGWLTDKEIAEYLEGIINEAEPINERGCILWCVDNPYRMPRDARKEYLFKPLYDIVAFMLKAYFLNPSVLHEMPGFRENITGALKSVYENSPDKEIINKLDGEGLYQFLCHNPDLNPELMRFIDDVRRSNYTVVDYM